MISAYFDSKLLKKKKKKSAGLTLLMPGREKVGASGLARIFQVGIILIKG